MNLWDPERLQRISNVMSRYAPHLYKGARLRFGIEGDPCNPYTNETAPVGTVESVERTDGEVRFRAVLDVGGTVDGTTGSLLGKDVWEIIDLEDFNRHTQGDVVVGGEEAENTYKGEIEARLAEISDKIEKINDMNADVRATTTSTLRYMASDLIRVSKRETPEFAAYYGDRYDEVVSQAEPSPSQHGVDRHDHEDDGSVYSGERKKLRWEERWD
jgi:hypothetical protein